MQRWQRAQHAHTQRQHAACKPNAHTHRRRVTGGLDGGRCKHAAQRAARAGRPGKQHTTQHNAITAATTRTTTKRQRDAHTRAYTPTHTRRTQDAVVEGGGSRRAARLCVRARAQGEMAHTRALHARAHAVTHTWYVAGARGEGGTRRLTIVWYQHTKWEQLRGRWCQRSWR